MFALRSVDQLISQNRFLCVTGLPGDVELYRDRRGSVSTQQTEHTERFEIEESTEFLPPVDISSSHIMDDLEDQVPQYSKLEKRDWPTRFLGSLWPT